MAKIALFLRYTSPVWPFPEKIVINYQVEDITLHNDELLAVYEGEMKTGPPQEGEIGPK